MLSILVIMLFLSGSSVVAFCSVTAFCSVVEFCSVAAFCSAEASFTAVVSSVCFLSVILKSGPMRWKQPCCASGMRVRHRAEKNYHEESPEEYGDQVTTYL